LCRGAHTILITDNTELNKKSIYKDAIIIPRLSELSPILSIIPLQLLSYYIGIGKGVTVDQPKSLAKVVKVDG